MCPESLECVSNVEQIALEQSDQKLIYPPTEKMGTIVVDHFPALGKLAALRFIEWAQQNHGGVISLPTGKTPEHFIRWVTRYLEFWNDPAVQEDLDSSGVNPACRPDMRGLHFVQIDEFYPIAPTQQNSFYHYVNKYYITGFGMDPRKALLMDCSRIGLPEGLQLPDVWHDNVVDLSLRYRKPQNHRESVQKQVLEAVDQWCYAYEEQIRALGGIGFFLGGIGPDGHIAFNVLGSGHHSTTRLTETNYETQASAATDLGGIEISRQRLVVTIGLETIIHNPDCTAILIAAGEAKANVVRDAIQQTQSLRYPATVLHRLPRARCYVTHGAAKLLTERRYANLVSMENVSEETVEHIVVDLALERGKRVQDLRLPDFEQNRCAKALLSKIDSDIDEITYRVDHGLRSKLESGSTVDSERTFLHTAPHHDDIMLGYLPHVVRHLRNTSNQHTFAYLTSGFTAVTNHHVLSLLQKLRDFLEHRTFEEYLREGYFAPSNVNGQNRDVWQYLDGVASGQQNMRDEGEARRLLRNLIEIFDEEDIPRLRDRIDELINYFQSQYPGKKDLPYIQQLKGMIREWEADCLWGYFGFDHGSVHHMRLGFYQGKLFTDEPEFERDVVPVLNLLREVEPAVVTVAFDPEASGPDTHYKVLQAVAEALKRYEQESGRSDIEVLGYRNVWFRFHPAETNLYVPVSLNMFAVMENSFLNAFASQRDASFPSYEHDGPFSELAQQIQVEQYQMLKTCLGREFFYEHPSPVIRATRGCVFLKKMQLGEFCSYARDLKEVTEAETA